MIGYDRPTLGRLVLDYLADRPELARVTRTRYRTVLFGFVEFVGNIAPADLNRKRVEAWVKSRDCAPTTLSHELGVVRGWCQWLALNEHTASEATLGVKVPRRRRQRQPLAPELIERAVSEPAGPRSRLIVSLAVGEALRPREIAELKLEDVDLDRAFVRVSGRHSRALPLSERTAQLVRAYLAVRPPGCDALIVSEPPAAPAPISPGHLGRLILDVLKASGAKRSPRDAVDAQGLRHTTMAGWKRAGADPAAISQAGGYRALAEVDAAHRPWPLADLAELVPPASTLPPDGSEAQSG